MCVGGVGVKGREGESWRRVTRGKNEEERVGVRGTSGEKVGERGERGRE